MNFSKEIKMNYCNICTNQASNPHRVIVNGKIVEGCVGEFHTGHLYGESLAWHNRPEAKSIRKRNADHLKKILAK